MLMISKKSRYQRLDNSSECPPLESIPLDILVNENVVEDGRVVSRTVAKTVIPEDQFKGLSSLDFCLDNRLASGNIDNLRPLTLDGSSIDSVESEVAKMETEFANLQTQESE